jgi:hypothetical protein
MMKTHSRIRHKLVCLSALAVPMFLLTPLAGCEKAEKKQETQKVFDLEAPGVDVEVEKSEEGGSVDVNVNGNE